MQRMRPLHDWPVSERQAVVGVFTDIDDTLTTHGHITPDALQALQQLKAAGLQVIAITGRPIGWCERLARGDADTGHAPWPLDAVVAENGAVAWVGPASNRSKIYQQEAAVRARNRARMRSVASRITSQVPAAQITRDSDGRETDLAIDAAEFAQLTPQEIAQVVAIMEAEGLHTTVSSIHIHGCYGVFNKWRGACWIAQQLLGRRLEDEIGQWVFVGDSGNDVAMFEHFVHSAGVANIRTVADRLSHLPRYVAPSERGAGFAEVAAAILQARQP
ncbi:HAD family hydrolase [Rhodoferax sp. GW822-FHT02A01]|uniref:HAD family hydrolase n=1 Tax=Rhodoferax sp. GW822-FHT02A01 TaxID=3141537 RepID=UPI00315D503A